ncbi:hypothetical protein BD311DRAFT_869709 [Dichomitus squalens]|uniref:F-box domain-containing protein n=1 Tax=Dichomitus squalens TaxID=114155 RepID=A0A4V2JYQ2_9APHY|nr:hypothetical protein BD311DRAFT_869709 [Dichomitus squalens]
MGLLPPEVWGLIVDQLQAEDQRTCLFLSKLHHDFALKALFAHVTVYFGLWRMDDGGLMDSIEKLEEMRRRNNTTFDVLRHISLSPDFARLVRTLSVRAFVDGGDGIFHTRALILAIQALPALRAFYWYGYSPICDDAIFSVLAQSAGPSLEVLRVPFTEHTHTSLTSFVRLRELRIDGVPVLESEGGAGVALHATQIALGALSGTLFRIAVSGDLVWGCSVRSLLGLQELEVILPEEPGGLALILRHCISLRSLSLFVLESDDLFSCLEACPTSLPDLRAFKFIHRDATFAHRNAEILAQFLRNKKKLRSLDVEISVDFDQGVHEQQLLEAITELTGLEVLGLNFQRPAWRLSDIELFDKHIPKGVTALRISAQLGQVDNEVLQKEWFDLFKKRTSLRYLQIFDKDRVLDLKQQILEDPPDALELLGYGPFLRWLVRDHDDPDDDRPKYSPCWSASKLIFRTVEDFGCADWEWLLRWHDYDGIYDLEPGPYDRVTGRLLLQ